MAGSLLHTSFPLRFFAPAVPARFERLFTQIPTELLLREKTVVLA
jgi:hypothetical protein